MLCRRRVFTSEQEELVVKVVLAILIVDRLRLAAGRLRLPPVHLAFADAFHRETCSKSHVL